MIYYFSGTGNSAVVAHSLSRLIGDAICSIAAVTVDEPSPDDDVLGLVFPVYAWGIPSVVRFFIERDLSTYYEHRRAPLYIYAVMTCGDDMGYADHILQMELKNAGIPGHERFSVWSVRMPNTYVALPSFDLDDASLAYDKFSETMKILPFIASSVANREYVVRLTRGSFPHLKSGLLRSLFLRYLIRERYFHVNAERCIHCGRCVRNCPTSDIRLDDKGLPRWNEDLCTGCLQCYHRCPVRAIDYGPFTKGKKQSAISRIFPF